ncbi:hypothetical protein RhiTH_003431 [Rhizoctonia solani]
MANVPPPQGEQNGWPPEFAHTQRELEDLFNQNPHYEYSWLGGLNAVFNHAFPILAPNRYTTRPKYLLREPLAIEAPVDDQDDSGSIDLGVPFPIPNHNNSLQPSPQQTTPNTPGEVDRSDDEDEGMAHDMEDSQESADYSVHSIGYLVAGRNLFRGPEPNKRTPDFVIDQYDSNNQNRRLVLVVEVKASITLNTGDYMRFRRYVARLQQINLVMEGSLSNVVIMLIAGGRAYSWRFEEWPLFLVQEQLNSREWVAVHQQGFLDLLADIRANHSPHALPEL